MGNCMVEAVYRTVKVLAGQSYHMRMKHRRKWPLCSCRKDLDGTDRCSRGSHT